MPGANGRAGRLDGGGAMEWYSLQVFRAVATERSFSRAAEKLFRTQPAVSLSVQRLEAELGERLIDRGGQGPAAHRRRAASCSTTPAGSRTCKAEMDNALAELRDNSAGRLTVGANESTTLYLLPHIAAYRRLYPRVQRAGAPQPVEQDPVAAGGGRPRAGRDQLRPAGPARDLDGDLHRPPGVRRLAAPPLRVAQDGVDPRPGAWRRSSPTTSCRPTGTSCCARSRSTGAAAHGRGDADGRDDPQAGAGERGRGVPAADVRRAGDRAADAVRGDR